MKSKSVRNSVLPLVGFGDGINIEGYGELHYSSEIRNTKSPAQGDSTVWHKHIFGEEAYKILRKIQCNCITKIMIHLSFYLD